MKGMTTCKVCGRDFALMVEEHYVVREPQKVGVLANLVNNDVALEYDAFDCPHCGCQNIMQGRKPIHLVQDTQDAQDGIKFSGCCSCVYVAKSENEEPCSLCSHRYLDRFTPMEEEEEKDE